MTQIPRERLSMLRKGPVKRIHVSQPNLRHNRDVGKDELPVFTIQTSKGPIQARTVDIKGPSRFPGQDIPPLSCGARIWLETNAEVFITW